MEIHYPWQKDTNPSKQKYNMDFTYHHTFQLAQPISLGKQNPLYQSFSQAVMSNNFITANAISLQTNIL